MSVTSTTSLLQQLLVILILPVVKHRRWASLWLCIQKTLMFQPVMPMYGYLLPKQKAKTLFGGLAAVLI